MNLYEFIQYKRYVASFRNHNVVNAKFCTRQPATATFDSEAEGRHDNRRAATAIEDQRRLSPASSESTVSRRSGISGGQRRPFEEAANTRRQPTVSTDDEYRRSSASEANRRATSQTAAARDVSSTDTDLPTSEHGSVTSVTGQFRLRSTVVPASLRQGLGATRAPTKRRNGDQ